MTSLSDPIARGDGLDGLAREIAAQLSGQRSAASALGARRAAVAAAQDLSRPELATALTSVSRAADLLAQARADVADATERAIHAETRAADLEGELADLTERFESALAEIERLRTEADEAERQTRAALDSGARKLADVRDRLHDAETRATQAEDNLQHLLHVVLDRLKV